MPPATSIYSRPLRIRAPEGSPRVRAWLHLVPREDGMDAFSHAHNYERFMGRWSRLLSVEFLRFAGLASANRVLDVGCGTGALTAAILAHTDVAQVVGIDPSPAFVEAARASTLDPRASFETGDARLLPFATGHFD